MKRFLLFIVLSFFCTKLSAQLDTEHWFSAMYDGQINNDPYQYLYLSTNDVNPFTVYIYSNNVVINQVVISKGKPQYVFIPRQYIIVENGNTNELFTPLSKGLNVKADRRFFANLRFGMTNHAEIITSKGAAALGKEFFTVVAPNQIKPSNDLSYNYGFQASVIATEDNTTVTINHFNKPLVFTDGNTAKPLTFKLNKGQSYIVDGRGITSGNKDGFIGAKVTSDKPVSLTNGNINGQYVFDAEKNDGSDILMDQSVPIENLGNEFGIISGMGDIIGTGTDLTNEGMERAIIVATKNNTAIYINNSPTPVKTINEGEYYFVPDTYYSKKASDHYNLFIKTTENVYVYQVLGGVKGSRATGSMNFIPPLGCYLPLTIDEIGLVDQLRPRDGSLKVKLNIITETGAKVKLNGTEINTAAGFGPFPLEGNSSWETYSVPNVKGNITVESDKAVNAGLAGGDGNAVGYAGYFAGFSTIPFIVKKHGVCIPDVVLELPEGYSSYQWFIRDEVTGNFEPIAGANSNEFRPIKPGIYIADVQRSVCKKVTTPEFKLLNCSTITNVDSKICNAALPIIPKLSNSSQTTDWNSISIMTPPANGSLNLDIVNNIFEYSPTVGFTGVDTFKYGFCGISSLPDCEEVTVKVTVGMVANDDMIRGCKIDSINGQFNLANANITTDASITGKKYYKTQLDADNDTGNNLILDADITNYISPEGFVYVRLKNSVCTRTVKIELKFFPVAELITDSYKVCDDKLEGQINIEFDKLGNHFLKDYNYFNKVNFYLDAGAAGTGLPNNWSYSENTTIYMKVASPDGCQAKVFPLHFIINPKVPVNKLTESEDVCDDEEDYFDYKKTVNNLADYRSLFTSDNYVSAKVYILKEDAQNNKNNNITSYAIQNQQAFYIRLSKNGVCDRLVELTLKIKIPEKSTVLEDKKICPEKLTNLDAGSGFLKYDWYNKKDPGMSLSQDQLLKNVGLGDYFVILTASNNCTYTQEVKITAVDLPEITEILIQNNTVTISAKNGNLPYLYSLDGITYQPSNVFTNVSAGFHKVYVISKDNCIPTIQDFTIIDIYNVLTPNGDGYNDVLNMSLLDTKTDVRFFIQDRNGTKVFEGNKSNKFIWDGKINGRSLPTSSYWYWLEWKDFVYSAPVKHTGWILLKNRNSH